MKLIGAFSLREIRYTERAVDESFFTELVQDRVSLLVCLQVHAFPLPLASERCEESATVFDADRILFKKNLHDVFVEMLEPLPKLRASSPIVCSISHRFSCSSGRVLLRTVHGVGFASASGPANAQSLGEDLLRTVRRLRATNGK